jgi:hypothetical protein
VHFVALIILNNPNVDQATTRFVSTRYKVVSSGAAALELTLNFPFLS